MDRAQRRHAVRRRDDPADAPPGRAAGLRDRVHHQRTLRHPLKARQAAVAMAVERDVLVDLVGDREPVVCGPSSAMNPGSSSSSTLPVGFWGVFTTIALTEGWVSAARSSSRSSRHVPARRSSRKATKRGTSPKIAACSQRDGSAVVRIGHAVTHLALVEDPSRGRGVLAELAAELPDQDAHHVCAGARSRLPVAQRDWRGPLAPPRAELGGREGLDEGSRWRRQHESGPLRADDACELRRSPATTGAAALDGKPVTHRLRVVFDHEDAGRLGQES